MPKKLNFLGGQQNYDPKTGEYEPALKGPNGESPSGFKSFKKSESSFDKNDEDSIWDAYEKGDITEKERNKLLSERSGKVAKGETEYFKHPQVDGVWHDTGETIEKNGKSYKMFENEQGKKWAVSDEFSKQFKPFDKNKETDLLSKDYLDKFYELSGGDEDKMLDLIRNDPAYRDYDDGDPNSTWSMGDLEGVVGAYFMKKNKGFDQINDKRMGKEQAKEEPNTSAMSIKEFSNYAKKMLKEKGIDTKGISVRGRYAGYSDALDVTVKDPNIDISEVEKLLRKHESYERDASGDILQGGNRYIHVQYDYDAFNQIKEEGKADAENLMKQADASKGNGIELSKGVYLFKDDGRYFIAGDYDKIGSSRTVYSPEDLAVMKWKLKKFGRLN